MTDTPSKWPHTVIAFPQKSAEAPSALRRTSNRASAVILRPAIPHWHGTPDEEPVVQSNPEATTTIDQMIAAIFGWDEPGSVRAYPTKRLNNIRSMEHLIPAIEAARLANPQEDTLAELKLAAAIMSDDEIAEAILSASPREIQTYGAYHAALLRELIEREINSRYFK